MTPIAAQRAIDVVMNPSGTSSHITITNKGKQSLSFDRGFSSWLHFYCYYLVAAVLSVVVTAICCSQCRRKNYCLLYGRILFISDFRSFVSPRALIFI
jgi:hypothetical protein